MSNTRGDAWGGTIAHRIRMATQVVSAVRQVVGSTVPVGDRISQQEADAAAVHRSYGSLAHRAASTMKRLFTARPHHTGQEYRMSATESNKAFVAQMLGEKKRLEDFPDRVDPNLVMHEPAHLPFGGTYRGLEEFQRFYPLVRGYYDFEHFELLGVTPRVTLSLQRHAYRSLVLSHPCSLPRNSRFQERD